MIIQIVWLNLEALFLNRSNEWIGVETRSWTSPTLRLSRGPGSEEKPVLYADSLEVVGLKFLRWVVWQTFCSSKMGQYPSISKLWCGSKNSMIFLPPDEMIYIYIYPQPTWNIQWSQEFVMPSMNSLKFNWIRLCKVMRVSNTASPIPLGKPTAGFIVPAGTP